MARKHVIILLIVITAVVALSLFLKKDQEPTLSESLKEAVDVVESSEDRLSEEDIAMQSPGAQMQVTEIPSHGQNQAEESRRLLEPKRKQTVLPKPDDRRLAQSSVLSGTSWKVWEGVAAYPQSAGKRSAYLAEINGYYLVEEDGFRGDDRHFSASQPLAVYNERKGIAGVVTGTIQITVNEGVNIDSLIQEYDLKVVGSMPEANMYFVTSAQDTFNLSSLKERLSSEPGISQAQLEILSRKYEKF